MGKSSFGKDVFKKILSFLTSNEAETAPADMPRSQSTPGTPSRGDATSHAPSDPLREFENRLAIEVSENGSAVSGRIQMLNLTKIAERLGPNWPVVSKKVHFIIQGILARRLSPADYFVRQDDDHYFFMFSGLSEVEARIKCAMLTREITAKLIGDEAGMAGLDLRFAVTRLEGGEPTTDKPLETLNLRLDQKQAAETTAGRQATASAYFNTASKDMLKDMLAILENINHNLRQKSPSSPATPPKTKGPSRLEGLAQLLRQAEHSFSELAGVGQAPEYQGGPHPDVAVKASVTDWQDIHGHPKRQSGPWEPVAGGGTGAVEGAPVADGSSPTPEPSPHAAPERQLFYILRKAINRTLVTIETELSRQQQPVEENNWVPQSWSESTPDEVVTEDDQNIDSKSIYLPMWQVKRRRINSYRLQIDLKVGNEIIVADTLKESELGQPIIAAMDRMTLCQAIFDIKKTLGSGRVSNSIIPVHFDTMVSLSGRRDYLLVCANIPNDYREAMIFELMYPYISMFNTPILQAITALKPYARALMVQVNIDYPHFEDLNLAGIYAVGTDLADCDRPERELIQKMEIFKIKAERCGLKTYLHNVNSLSLATAAVCAGFDHLDGAAIAAPLNQPEGVYPYEIEDLYAHLLGSGKR